MIIDILLVPRCPVISLVGEQLFMTRKLSLSIRGVAIGSLSPVSLFLHCGFAPKLLFKCVPGERLVCRIGRSNHFGAFLPLLACTLFGVVCAWAQYLLWPVGH